MHVWSLNAASLSVVVAFFFATYLIMQIPAGMCYARFGVRKVFPAAVLITGVGVAVFGMATHSWQASIGRMLMGFGSAFAFLGTLNLSAQWLSHRYFAMIAGIVQFAGCLGSMLGQAPMASLVNMYHWRNVMFVVAAVCFALALIYWILIRDKQTRMNHHTDVKQTTVLKHILKKPQVWCIFLISFCAWATIGGFAALWGVPYLMRLYAWTNEIAGQHLIWLWLGVGLGSPIMGWITAHARNVTYPIITCFSIGIIGIAMVIYPPTNNTYWVTLALLFIGFACSSQSLSFGVLKDNVSRAYFPAATGINNLMAILAAAITQMLAGTILHYHGSEQLVGNAPTYSIHAYQMAFLPIAFCLVLGLIIAVFFLKETHCKPIEEKPL